ncbi:hypothetical protein HPG69_007890 [Diceros bicornis minor]|uniref:Uncharacterized protein n=1 Tax=Diceros bicornis minor TaxID=77932 RepID=A0A7J7EB20_DICBM|nr:hypothetical protein HPG69_007890 [Diceros bicornis minor]
MGGDDRLEANLGRSAARVEGDWSAPPSNQRRAVGFKPDSLGLRSVGRSRAVALACRGRAACCPALGAPCPAPRPARRMAHKQIYYSDKYFDEHYEYRATGRGRGRPCGVAARRAAALCSRGEDEAGGPASGGDPPRPPRGGLRARAGGRGGLGSLPLAGVGRAFPARGVSAAASPVTAPGRGRGDRAEDRPPGRWAGAPRAGVSAGRGFRAASWEGRPAGPGATGFCGPGGFPDGGGRPCSSTARARRLRSRRGTGCGAALPSRSLRGLRVPSETDVFAAVGEWGSRLWLGREPRPRGSCPVPSHAGVA